jgi:hypothetical protein
LREIVNAAARAKNARRGQPRNAVAYFIMQDAAAMFEWVTGKKATRAINFDTGTETSPFHKFAAALWPVVFGESKKGLSSALKNWAAARKKYRERSPLMRNINVRHRQWRVFEA